MLYLKPPATCWSPTALKKPDRSKQCHYLQFAQSASQPLDMQGVLQLLKQNDRARIKDLV